jgi:hypothetical protein
MDVWQQLITDIDALSAEDIRGLIDFIEVDGPKNLTVGQIKEIARGVPLKAGEAKCSGRKDTGIHTANILRAMQNPILGVEDTLAYLRQRLLTLTAAK